MMLSTQRVTSLLPKWLDIEFRYGIEKHGVNNPQLQAFTEGLKEGGRGYMEYLGYLGRAIVFSGERNRIVDLQRAQTLGKYLNVSTALMCVFASRRLGTDLPGAFDAEVSDWQSTTLPGIFVGSQMSLHDQVIVIKNSLLDISESIADEDIAGAEELARALCIEQASFVTSQFCEINCMAAPGFTSGDAREWPTALVA